jgi:hypothetical protein
VLAFQVPFDYTFSGFGLAPFQIKSIKIVSSYFLNDTLMEIDSVWGNSKQR